MFNYAEVFAIRRALCLHKFQTNKLRTMCYIYKRNSQIKIDKGIAAQIYGIICLSLTSFSVIEHLIN